MTVEALLALSVFAFATSITPGPNNMMLLASGVNFGFRRTIPHMLGIGFGFTAMLVVVGLGLGAALTASPSLLTVLKLVSAGYMLWLAWRLASSGSIGSAVGAAKPMRFIEAAGFQWINPKAWAMALTATTVYTRPDAFLATVLVVALVFGSINLPSVSVWAAFGTGLRGFLAIPARMRVFNIVMAGLLALSIIPFVL
jgi:threonine/homoserine/homoserine lactone efflux protein